MNKESAINVASLNKYFGRQKVLNDLSFSVPYNSISGFLGPNGAGKTTTLRILMGLIPLLDGSINLLGEGLPQGRSKAVEQIGAVVENPNFITNMSAVNNLKWFGSLYKPVNMARVLEVIELVGLKDAAQQRFGAFSSGMKQRLGVAFGILHKPRLLVLDEPTSGMDPAGRVQMREILQKIHREENTSIFLSSHLLDEVQRLCDYVVIIDRGRTIKEGFVKEILANHQEAWELRVSDKDAKKAVQVLQQFVEQGISWTQLPRGYEVTMPPAMSAVLNKALVEAEVGVTAIIPREASLEDTFIKLTTAEQSKENS